MVPRIWASLRPITVFVQTLAARFAFILILPDVHKENKTGNTKGPETLPHGFHMLGQGKNH